MLQASLWLVWGVAALTTMVLGARRDARGVWLAGAMLMTIVVVMMDLRAPLRCFESGRGAVGRCVARVMKERQARRDVCAMRYIFAHVTYVSWRPRVTAVSD